MKKFLHLFFITLGFLSVLLISESLYKVYAVESTEIERSDDEIAKNCPAPGNENLISICGNVRQAMDEEKVLTDGTTAESVSQIPVEGVSVYLYECDNTSPTCKRNGLLVHPFSSTTTNKYGNFHLLARKMDGNWDVELRDEITGVPLELSFTLQSKRRYLIFRCNASFQGIHVIPSYENLVNVIHEVNCPTDYEYEYSPITDTFDFIPNERLSNQMGIEPDGYYPEQATAENPTSEYHMAAQAYYDEYSNQTRQSVYIKLEGGDPRFTEPSHDEGKSEALNTLVTIDIAGLEIPTGGLDSVVPTNGAWWSYDCLEKYRGTKWETLCAGYNNGQINNDERVDVYENSLYDDPKFTTQHLLPNIPPAYSILYYRPLEVRHDLSGYYQDSNDIAKFLGLEFSNCVGSVFKRRFGEEKENQYPNCEILKECNKTIGTSTYRNSYTTGGPAQGLASPAQYDQLVQEVATDVPVCVIEGEEKPVTLGEIQQPGESCEEGYRLCEDGSYWNNYYLTNLGRNNLTLKWGMAFENYEDSYQRPENTTNATPMQAGMEGKDVPMTGGVSATANSGGRAANGSIGAAAEITSSLDSSSTEALTDWIAQPFEDEVAKRETMSGTTYYVSNNPIGWGQYSRTNSAAETLITTPEDDNEILDNYFSDRELEGTNGIMNDNHYPGEDLSSNTATISGGEKGGTRTGTSGIYVTTPAVNRLVALSENGWDTQASDLLDSAISISTGHGYIDWKMAEVEGAPTIGDAFRRIVTLLFGRGERKDNKTFSDRDPSGLGDEPEELVDSLLAEGFEVNEANFKTLFPLPCTSTGLDTEDWGVNQGCYPWNKIPINETCGTSKAEPQCLENGAKPGEENENGTNNGISRTCRVDECYEANVSVKCTCTRTLTNYEDVVLNGVDPKYSYYKDCPRGTDSSVSPPWFVNNVSINFTQSACKSSTVNSDRLTCAQLQKTCYIKYDPNDHLTQAEQRLNSMRDCVKETYYDRVAKKVEEVTDDATPCEKLNYGPEFNSEGLPIQTTTKDLNGSASTPLCAMSIAGPNECDGNVDRNVDINVTQEPVDKDKDLKQINADGIPEAGAKFYKSFRDPFIDNINPQPAAWVSVSSSMNNTETDLTKRKDWAGIGTGAGAFTRAQFGQPNSFGEAGDLNPLYVHCQNNVLGTDGLWDDNKSCNFNTLPNPEVLKLEDLKNEIPSNNSCELNTSAQCARLVLGESETGEALKFSDTFETIMNLAGNKFGVEPAAILTYMAAINTTQRYAYYWSEQGEEELQNASLPWYGTFNFCDDLEHPAQKPYDWILTFFIQALRSEKTGAENLLNYLSQGRGNTASRCNFLDATVVTAANLSVGGPGSECNSSWEDAKAKISTMMWGSNPRGNYETQYNSYLDGEYKDGVTVTYEDLYNACK